MFFGPLLALASTYAVLAIPGAGNFSSNCTQKNNKLSFGTYRLSTDCESAYFCADNNTCAHKGCRRDDFPFGYSLNQTLPHFCSKGQFCPDEEDQCLDQLPVGSPCQLDRDDECAPPDDWKKLAGPRNTNGSICLNFVCTWANATLGTSCTIGNMPYVVYDQTGHKEYVTIVSRDNCVTGTYCDGRKRQCLQEKAMNAACGADKECASDNCDISGTCGRPTNTTKHVASWLYGVILAAILGSMAAILRGLYMVHRKSRLAEQEKRAQYWREQEAFRNNILSMREQARASTQSLSLPRGDPYRDVDYGPSEPPRSVLYPATKSSALRNNFPDDTDADSMEEALVPSNEDDDFNARNRARGMPSGGRL